MVEWRRLSRFPAKMGTLRADDVTATRTSKTTIDLVGKTTTLHVHLTFLYISLPFLHDYDVKLPNFTFSGGRIRPRRNFIIFLNLNMVLRNSTPGGFAYIWRTKWVGIIAIKTERTQIQFWSDVFAAFASSYRKVPNDADSHARTTCL